MNARARRARPRSASGWVRALACALTLGSTLVPAPTIAEPSAAPPLPSPLTFEAAVQHAVERYPEILASMARVDAQRSALDLARTAYLPRLDSGAQVNQATRNNVSGLLLPGLPYPAIAGPVVDESSSTAWGSAAAVLFSWEAFDFGLRGASMDYARAQLARATAGAELTRLDVAVRAGAAFLSLAAAEETVRAARANVDRQQVFADSVRALVTNELRPGADGSRAQAELAHARVQLIRAEQAQLRETPVRAVALLRDGGRRLVVSGDRDGAVRLWAPEKSKPLVRAMTGHSDAVSALAVGRVGKTDMAVSASADATLRRWDLAKQRTVGDAMGYLKQKVSG